MLLTLSKELKHTKMLLIVFCAGVVGFPDSDPFYLDRTVVQTLG